MNEPLSPVRSSSRREAVLAHLREAIVTRRLPEGRRLIEADLAAELGVSRTPVREALSALAREGLVDLQPHRGAVVLGVREDEIPSLQAIHLVLQSDAMARAAVRATEDDLRRLERIAADLDHISQFGDFLEVNAMDIEFHHAVVELAGFGLLQRIWDALVAAMQLRSAHIHVPGATHAAYMKQIGDAHRPLIDALRARHPERAKAAIREHLLEFDRRFEEDRLTNLAGSSDGSPVPAPR